jgi:hypothetical protein
MCHQEGRHAAVLGQDHGRLGDLVVSGREEGPNGRFGTAAAPALACWEEPFLGLLPRVHPKSLYYFNVHANPSVSPSVPTQLTLAVGCDISCGGEA